MTLKAKSGHTVWAPAIKPPRPEEVSSWMTTHRLIKKLSQTLSTSQDGTIDITLSGSSQVNIRAQFPNLATESLLYKTHWDHLTRWQKQQGQVLLSII